MLLLPTTTTAAAAVWVSKFALRSGASLVFLHDLWVLVPEVVSCLEEREEALEAVMLLEEELGEKQAAATRAAAALGPVAAADKRLAALNASIHALTVGGGQRDSTASSGCNVPLICLLKVAASRWATFQTLLWCLSSEPGQKNCAIPMAVCYGGLCSVILLQPSATYAA